MAGLSIDRRKIDLLDCVGNRLVTYGGRIGELFGGGGFGCSQRSLSARLSGRRTVEWVDLGSWWVLQPKCPLQIVSTTFFALEGIGLEPDLMDIAIGVLGWPWR